MELRRPKPKLPEWAEHRGEYDVLSRHNFPPDLDPNGIPNFWLVDKAVTGKPMETKSLDAFYERLHRLISDPDLHKAITVLTPDQVKSPKDMELIDTLFHPEKQNYTRLMWKDVADLARIRQTQPRRHARRVEMIRLVYEYHLYPKLTDPIYMDVPTSLMHVSTRRRAWEACTLLSLLQSPPKRYTSVPRQVQRALDYIFRLDMFGNIVSIYAKPRSACALHYDHQFPRSRGGRTNDLEKSPKTNIAVIHTLSNLSKQDQLLTFVDVAEMCLGYDAYRFIQGLTSKNGYLGVRFLQHCLGYDILSPKGEDEVPDRKGIGWLDNDASEGRMMIRNAIRTIALYEEQTLRRYVRAKSKTTKERRYPFTFVPHTDVNLLMPGWIAPELQSQCGTSTYEVKMLVLQEVLSSVEDEQWTHAIEAAVAKMTLNSPQRNSKEVQKDVKERQDALNLISGDIERLSENEEASKSSSRTDSADSVEIFNQLDDEQQRDCSLAPA